MSESAQQELPLWIFNGADLDRGRTVTGICCPANFAGMGPSELGLPVKTEAICGFSKNLIL
jgi:hypothetical protein